MYKTSFSCPEGAKLSKLSVTELVDHALDVIENGIEPDCETCPLTYILVGEEEKKFCWLIDKYKVYHNGWYKPQCELNHYKNFVLKLIQRCYGE